MSSRRFEEQTMLWPKYI